MKSFGLLLFWLATSSFVIGQEALFEALNKSNSGIPTTQVLDVCEAINGYMLLATPKGVMRFDGRSFELTPMEGGVIGLFNWDNKTYGYSTLGDLYWNESGLQWRKHPVSEAIRRNIGFKLINEMAVVDGKLHVSTVVGGGLFQISNDQKVTKIDLEARKPFQFFLFGGSQQGIICGTQRSTNGQRKMMAFIDNRALEITLSSGSAQSRSRSLRLRNGTFLYGKGNEVIHFSSEEIISRQFVEHNVQAIHEDVKGRIWVALDRGGLLCFPSGELTSRSRLRYLSQHSIDCIYESSDGILWFGSSGSGLFKLTASIQQIGESHTSSIDTVKRPANQTIHLETKKPAPDTNQNKNLSSTLPLPKVFITAVTVDNKDTAVLQSYLFDPSISFLRFTYSGFMPQQGELQYRYRLIGQQSKWVFTANNTAQFTSLPPGNYLFEVYAANKEGNWSESAAQVSFVVEPFWYAKTKYQVLLGVLGLGLLFVVFWRYNVITKQRSRSKAEIQKKLADLELQSLRSQMNPHFIFNTLSSIQHFITGNKTEDALRYLSKFAKLMRTILDNSKSSMVSIKEELNALTLYLELEKLRFKQKFDFEIHIDSSIEPEFDDIPPLIMQPYVENALLHGIMPLDAPGKIDIWIKRNDEYISIVIEDNGIGREASMRAKKRVENKSLGMKITKGRLDIINKINQSDLSVNIHDKVDENNQPLGTRVEIFIPVKDE